MQTRTRQWRKTRNPSRIRKRRWVLAAMASPEELRVGTWNMSHRRSGEGSCGGGGLPLERAHGAARRCGLRLHHGAPVRVTGRDGQGRLHAVRLAPREGLTRGLLLLSVYIPVQNHGPEAKENMFVAAFV